MMDFKIAQFPKQDTNTNNAKFTLKRTNFNFLNFFKPKIEVSSKNQQFQIDKIVYSSTHFKLKKQLQIVDTSKITKNGKKSSLFFNKSKSSNQSKDERR